MTGRQEDREKDLPIHQCGTSKCGTLRCATLRCATLSKTDYNLLNVNSLILQKDAKNARKNYSFSGFGI
jgi:hypothetical protein